MYEITDNRPLPGNHSMREGLTRTIREMCKDDSIEIPCVKKASAYSAARLAGAKVTVRDTGKGNAIVWRIDGPERPPRSHLPAGQPVKSAPTQPAPILPAPAAPSKPTPAPGQPRVTRAKGGYYTQPDPYGPSIFVPDDPASTKNGILG